MCCIHHDSTSYANPNKDSFLSSRTSHATELPCKERFSFSKAHGNSYSYKRCHSKVLLSYLYRENEDIAPPGSTHEDEAVLLLFLFLLSLKNGVSHFPAPAVWARLLCNSCAAGTLTALGLNAPRLQKEKRLHRSSHFLSAPSCLASSVTHALYHIVLCPDFVAVAMQGRRMLANVYHVHGARTRQR